MAHSSDVDRDFLYYDQGMFLVQTFGLYIRENSLDKLLKATPENIHSIEFSKDYETVLTFDSTDEERFNFFAEKYEDVLNDYFFIPGVVNVNENKYIVYVNYKNGYLSIVGVKS